MKKKPKIAIVHDNFLYIGGTERVIQGIHDIWPDAPIYTSTVAWDKLGVFHERIRNYRPITSFIQKIPYFPSYPYLYRYFLPLIWRIFDFSKYDIVISSSYSQMSHLINVPKNVLHICYCHGVPRHLYGYETDFDWEKYLFIQALAKIGNIFLRSFDYRAAGRVDHYIASSYAVAKRIKKHYGIEATVIYSPCIFPEQKEQKNQANDEDMKKYYLVASRLSRRKHVDIIIRACNELKLPLKIAGSGPEKDRLQKRAGPTVEFLDWIDEDLSRLYRNCKAVICAGKDEELGLAAVEAMRFGRPVIAYYSGGHKETVIEGKTGTFFKELSIESLIGAIRRLSKYQIQASDCQNNVEKFSLDLFKSQMKQFIVSKYYEFTLSKS